MNPHDLEAGLVTLVHEFWAVNQKPLLLSNLPPLLTSNGLGDYKTVLSGSSLKSFVNRVAGTATFQVVTHPVHKAKVGLIPSGSTYTFTASEACATTQAPVTRPSRATELLDLLGHLSPADLENVVIPVSILVKLHSQS